MIAQAPSMARSAIVLALGVALSNLFFLNNTSLLAASENPWDNYADIDPARAESVVREISKFTPELDVDPAAVALALGTTASENFLAGSQQEDGQITEASQLEQSYEVQKGDTMSTIAQKFGLHVATLLDRNGLGVNDIESMKIGQTLIIPASDTSDSTEWLTALNDKKAAEAAARAKAEAAKKKSLATSTKGSRSATVRERSSVGYNGDGAAGGFIVPINHNGITRGVGRGHSGIDYRANIGTNVRAAADGRVIETTGGWGGGFGISVLIDNGGGLTTRYAHLSSLNVSAGDSVGQGESVGLSGNTGFSTGPHLHFEAQRNGRVVSPF